MPTGPTRRCLYTRPNPARYDTDQEFAARMDAIDEQVEKFMIATAA